MSRGGRRAAGGGRRPGYLYQYHIVSFNNNRQSAEANVLHHMISFAYSFTCKFDTKKTVYNNNTNCQRAKLFYNRSIQCYLIKNQTFFFYYWKIHHRNT